MSSKKNSQNKNVIKKKSRRVIIRKMILEDLSEVWHIGEKIFSPSDLPFTYRSWNVEELLSLFNDDPDLCLVAEDLTSNKIVGFALGVILKRPHSSWKYGYFNWVAVAKIKQGSGIGKRLYVELEKRFKKKGARIALVDVEGNNPAGIEFVKEVGFKRGENYIWFSKNIED